MKRIALAALAAGLLASVSCASGKTFELSYTDESGDYGVSATLEASPISGTNNAQWLVDGVQGTVSGTGVPGGSPAKITGVISGGASPFITPSGGFEIDNVLYFTIPASGKAFDYWGLGFFTGGIEWNLWDNGSGSPLYTLGHSGSGYPGTSLGSASVAAIPEASTWAMMGLGFAGLALAGSRSRSRCTAMSIE
jgi:hypothetical protein